MNSEEWISLLVLTTATSFTPGPNTTLSAALGGNGGLRLALPFVAAVPVGWALLFTLCAAGVGTLVTQWPVLRWSIVAMGVGYLLWLAARLARSSSLSNSGGQRGLVGFWPGVGLQFLNIKAWFLGLAVAGGWIAGRPDALDRYALILPVLMGYALASNLTYALIGSLLQNWLQGPWLDGQASGRRLRVFNRSMAAALVLTAIWMLRGVGT